MRKITTLERAAIDAHDRGETWAEFWQQHGDAVREAEPFDRMRYHRLVRTLLGLFTTGGGSDRSMQDAPDSPAPWHADDRQEAVGVSKIAAAGGGAVLRHAGHVQERGVDQTRPPATAAGG